jgi:uncharacterized protein (TIGR02646 family)
MRSITKSASPQVLNENAIIWYEELALDPDSKPKKRRYAHPEIKQKALEETHSKCIYCESKVGHNTPGDIEHIEPASVVPEKRFEWSNLTIACTECNRRKNNYFSANNAFLNPYVDQVEDLVIHRGPIVDWRDDSEVAEISIKILELHNERRIELIKRKISIIAQVNEIKGRIRSEGNPLMKELLERQLEDMTDISYEYSGMIKSLI